MGWQDQLKGDSLSWLLEEDSPGVRYLAMRNLAGVRGEELRRARKAAHERGPIAAILRHMNKEGFWARPGPGYNPKYRSADWSLLTLAQLGACADEDPRIRTGIDYLLDHGLAKGGMFSTSPAPSGTVDCLQGNMCWALLELGCDDPRLESAFDWMARTVTGEGMAPIGDREATRRYYAYKCGPGFACGVNGGKPCAWGGVKVMLALSRLPEEKRTPRIKRAIQRGVDFLFSVDPATAAYPTRTGDKPNRSWWKFGFPQFYVTDLLQLVEVLVGLGYGSDPRLAHALTMVRDKQDAHGRWSLDQERKGKTWVSFGAMHKPNKWATLRALRVLKAVDGA